MQLGRLRLLCSLPRRARAVRVPLLAGRFSNIVLWNRFLQTFDYAKRRVHLARQGMHLRYPSSWSKEGGEYALVLSEASPYASEEAERAASANWMSSEGRATGTIFFRFVLPDEPGGIMQPKTRLVPAGEDAAAALSRWVAEQPLAAVAQ